MSYRITPVSAAIPERRRLAVFLAAFVLTGGLAVPRRGDDDPSAWERRMSSWWDKNPHCHEDSPKGYLLEKNGALVGFSGLIPYGYECDGKPVPSLVSTSLFVESAHRSAVVGLLARQRALGDDWQIIDGSPSPEMGRLLAHLGYRSAGDRAQYLFPARLGGGGLARQALLARDWSFSLPAAGEAVGCRLVLDPEEWNGFSVPQDGRIHRASDRATTQWLLHSGSEPKRFFGLLGEDGDPIACALAAPKRSAGFCASLLLDHRDHHPGGAGLALLMRKLIDSPEGVLFPGTRVVVLSRFGGGTLQGSPGRRMPSDLWYHLPPSWQNHTKACLPIEGDLALL